MLIAISFVYNICYTQATMRAAAIAVKRRCSKKACFAASDRCAVNGWQITGRSLAGVRGATYLQSPFLLLHYIDAANGCGY
jgi:hypothetical protein